MAQFLQPFSGSKTGTGNKIRVTLDWVTGYFSYKMEKGSVTGSSKCWDNTWITAIVKKELQIITIEVVNYLYCI